MLKKIVIAVLVMTIGSTIYLVYFNNKQNKELNKKDDEIVLTHPSVEELVIGNNWIDKTIPSTGATILVNSSINQYKGHPKYPHLVKVTIIPTFLEAERDDLPNQIQELVKNIFQDSNLAIVGYINKSSERISSDRWGFNYLTMEFGIYATSQEHIDASIKKLNDQIASLFLNDQTKVEVIQVVFSDKDWNTYEDHLEMVKNE